MEQDSVVRLTSLNKALDALESFTVDRPEWSLAELSAHLRLTRPSLHRILRNLEARGYLRQDPVTRRYQLGLKTWDLATVALDGFGLQRTARPWLHALAETTGEQATLWIYDLGDAVCVDRVEGPQRVRSYTRIGTREPAHLLAAGRSLLAFQSETEVARVVAALGEDAELRTVVPEGLPARLQAIRDRGHDVSQGDRWADVYAVGAPVRDYSGLAVAAIGVSGPSSRFDEAAVLSIGRRLIEAARTVSGQLGGRGISGRAPAGGQPLSDHKE